MIHLPNAEEEEEAAAVEEEEEERDERAAVRKISFRFPLCCRCVCVCVYVCVCVCVCVCCSPLNYARKQERGQRVAWCKAGKRGGACAEHAAEQVQPV